MSPPPTQIDTIESDDFSALESWLAEGSHEPSMKRARKVASKRQTYTATSRGHCHEHFFSKRAGSWSDLGASPELNAALNSRGYGHPAVAQVDAWGAIAEGRPLLLAHPPGTGKTLAYLAPLAQRCAAWEAAEGPAAMCEARVVVVVPTHELAQQLVRQVRDGTATGTQARTS